MASYIDTGLWGVYAGTAKKRVYEVIELIAKEIKGLGSTVTASELKKSKDQIKGNLIMALESTSSRMQNLARQEIYHGRHFSADEIIREVDSVTLGQVKELLERLVHEKAFALTLLGPVMKRILRDLLLSASIEADIISIASIISSGIVFAGAELVRQGILGPVNRVLRTAFCCPA